MLTERITLNSEAEKTLDGLTSLDEDIIDGHLRSDGCRLAELYYKAGSIMEARGDTEAACFFYTQGYVFALDEQLLELANELISRLRQYGKED